MVETNLDGWWMVVTIDAFQLRTDAKAALQEEQINVLLPTRSPRVPSVRLAVVGRRRRAVGRCIMRAPKPAQAYF